MVDDIASDSRSTAPPPTSQTRTRRTRQRRTRAEHELSLSSGCAQDDLADVLTLAQPPMCLGRLLERKARIDDRLDRAVLDQLNKRIEKRAVAAAVLPECGHAEPDDPLRGPQLLEQVGARHLGHCLGEAPQASLSVGDGCGGSVVDGASPGTKQVS